MQQTTPDSSVKPKTSERIPLTILRTQRGELKNSYKGLGRVAQVARASSLGNTKVVDLISGQGIYNKQPMNA